MKKTVLVTGVGYGLGKQLALDLCQSYNVIGVTRHKNKIALMSNIDTIDIYESDFLNDESVDSLCNYLKNKNIDVVINNSSLGLGTLIEFDSVENWEKTYKVNIFSVIKILNVLLPNMIKNKNGHIINISSLGAYDIYPGGASYISAKKSLSMLSDSLRMELKQHGIRVSEIVPGGINSDNKNDNFIDPKVISELIANCIELPKNVNIDKIFINHV